MNVVRECYVIISDLAISLVFHCFRGISPRNSTSFTRPFLTGRCVRGWHETRIIRSSIQVLRVMSQSPTHLLLCTQSHSNIPIRVHPILKVYHITHVLQIHPILQVQPILFILPVCLIPPSTLNPPRMFNMLNPSRIWVCSIPLGC